MGNNHCYGYGCGDSFNYNYNYNYKIKRGIRTGIEKDIYQIALKNPHGLNYIFYNPYEKTFECEYNIQDWLSSMYNGINKPNKCPWEHWIIYNDEPPFIFNQSDANYLKPKATAGYCKGILAWNDSEMSWLIHSVPRFPDTFFPGVSEFMGENENRVFSEIHYSEEIYGHSFAYFYKTWENAGVKVGDGIEELLEHIRLMEPCVYLSKGFWGTSYSDKWDNLISRNYYPVLVEPASVVMKTSDEYIEDLKCWKGVEGKWEHYAKSPRYETDFYETLAQQKGGCRVESSCIDGNKDTYSSALVSNNEMVFSWRFMKEGSPNPLTFRVNQDHSKWAISTWSKGHKMEERDVDDDDGDRKRGSGIKWVCIGDLNRIQSHAKRGGGGMMIMDEELHEAWKKLVGF